MTEFKREERYIVFKLKDLLTPDEEILRCIQKNSNAAVGCVVVEDDWLIYELVWDLIRATVERPDDIEQIVERLKSSLNNALKTEY